MTDIEFTVPGEPASKSRARFSRRGSKVVTYTPQKTLDAEQCMAAAFLAAGGTKEEDAEVTFMVEAEFYNGTHQRRDVDNMLKLVLDGLNGVAWVDDVQVTMISGRKEYVGKEGDPRTVVRVRSIGRIDRLTVICQHCGEAFKTWPSQRAKVKFCSADCRSAARSGARLRVCANCGRKYEGRTHRDGVRYCSTKCRSDAGRVEIPCRQCGAPFMQVKSWVEQRPYCSTECQALNARARRRGSAKGTCRVCGGGTSKKQYTRCHSCKVLGLTEPQA